MSQSESPLPAVIANIVSPAHTERALPCLAELADHAFALADQQAGHDPSNALPGICTKNRQAKILYTVEDSVELPIKVVLYQDVPAVQIQRVVVNMQTETVQCDGRPSLPIEMQQIEPARQELKLYLQVSLDTLQDVWDSLWRPHDRYIAWQNFLRRLESNGISSAQSQVCADPPSFEKPCPSCDAFMTLCTSCYAVICLNQDCPVSRLIPFQLCSRDTYKAACLPCLQKIRGFPPPSFGQCPECNLWFCNHELTWCLGRFKETAKKTPSDTTHGISNSVLEHPTKPIVCSYCELGQAVLNKCYNAKCWSKEGGKVNLRICQSCSPGGGISCACKRSWFCDNCHKEPPTADCLKQCPQCKRAYCVRGCSEYIQFCSECGRTTLCDDCAEEDWSSFTELDGPEVQVELVRACQTDSCPNMSCEKCLEEQYDCPGCWQTYCNSCLDEGAWCKSCERVFCEECIECCRSCGKTYCEECLRQSGYRYCPQCSDASDY